MTISACQKPNETAQGGQPHKLQQNDSLYLPPNERYSLMDPRQSDNYNASAVNKTISHQQGNNNLSSTEKQPDMNPGGTSAEIPQPTSSEIKNSLGDKSAPTGESINHAQDAQNSLNTITAAPITTSDLPLRRSGPRNEVNEGYERKIGRGTSWRRDHEARVEGDYTVRGRGRGGSQPSRGSGGGGRGRYHQDHDSRDYPYRREYDRRPPLPSPPPPPPPLPPGPASSSAHHPSLDPRAIPYPPPDPYYDSRGTYPSPPLYGPRRDYPPDPAATRYYDEFRRGGYDPRDGPPVPPPPRPAAATPPQALDSRRPYDRGPLPGRDDPSDYGRPYSRSRDPRDDYPPRDLDVRLPPDHRISPRDIRPDPRYIDEGRNPRRMDDPRMLPPAPTAERRARDPLEYRDDDMHRRPSIDRSYTRVVSRDIDPSIQSDKPQNKPEDSPNDAKHKEMTDPGRETLNNGNVGVTTARPPPPPAARGADPKIEATSYNYDRERHHAPPPQPQPPPVDRYREPPPSDYGRAGYSTFEGRGGHGNGGSMGRGVGGARDSDPRDSRDPPTYDKPRGPRDPYYSSPTGYPAVPPPSADYRGRDDYPPRAAQPPLDYIRGPVPPPPATYEERYPRGSPMDLEPPPRGREGYRDLPPRQHDYTQKRKYDGPDYVDPYVDDYRAREPRYPDRPLDYPPRPPYDYDDRDLKRIRGPLPPDPRDPAYGRPPYDDRGPPPRDYDRSLPPPANNPRREFHRPERSRPHGRYFLVKTSTAENIAKSRETNRWGIPVKDVEIFREAFKMGDVSLIFALDESGRFLGYAEMASDVDAVPPMSWMEEHCTPVGAAFEVKHRTTYRPPDVGVNSSDDVRTTATTKARNFITEGKPIRFGQDGQEISPKEAASLIDELERMSGPENAERRAHAVVSRGGSRGGRIRNGRGRSSSYYHDSPRGGRGRGRG